MTKLVSAAAPSDGAGIDVMRIGDAPWQTLVDLLARFGLELMPVAQHQCIPGSYWGDCEAGLIECRIYVRSDTPLHSLLHEAGHFICMDSTRRRRLYRDAGGDFAEENAVCYLQILLADHVPGMGRQRMFADMDAWGYTFRLGSVQTWFEQDADDARQWLMNAGIVNAAQMPCWRIRFE